MLNVKCVNDKCPEFGIVKRGLEQLPDIVNCGDCWEPCEPTDEPFEVNDASPAN